MKYYRYFALICLMGFSFSCQEDTEKQEEIPAESFRNEVAATEVRVATAETKSFDYLINATGKLEAAAQVKAVIEQPGYLIELPIREGQSVTGSGHRQARPHRSGDTSSESPNRPSKCAGILRK